MRIFLLNFLFILLILPASAQDLQGWLIYFGTTKIKNSKFSIHQELQLRDYKLVGDHNQTLIRVAGQYQFNPSLNVSTGYAFIHTEAQGTPNRPFSENRIYQEALLSHSISKSKLRHRFRLEERFIEDQAFRGRLRYCLFLDVPLTNKGFSKNGIYVAAYDEVFLNLSDQKEIKIFDRNRAYLGLGFKIKDNLGTQLGFMRQNVNNMSGSNHLLLSIHQTIGGR